MNLLPLVIVFAYCWPSASFGQEIEPDMVTITQEDYAPEDLVDTTKLLPILEKLVRLIDEPELTHKINNTSHDNVVELLETCCALLENYNSKLSDDQLNETVDALEEYVSAPTRNSCHTKKFDNLIIRDRLKVLGNALFRHNVTICGALNVNGALVITNPSFCGTPANPVTIGGVVNIGCGTCPGDAITICNPTVDGNLIVTNNVTIGDCLLGTGDVLIGGDLTVCGTITEFGLPVVTSADTTPCSDALARFNGLSTTQIINAPLRAPDVSGTQPTSALLADDCITTDLNLALIPKGTGALTADIPDGFATGGDPRGIFAVDWQMTRGLSSQVASGANATLSGGDSNTVSAQFGSIGGGLSNTVTGTGATIGGGDFNTASELQAFVGGGSSNTASGINSVVAGGSFNSATTLQATVGGGDANTASGIAAFIGGGNINTASGDFSTIIAGRSNTVSAEFGTIGGGTTNMVTATGATVSGGNTNTASAAEAFVGGGQLNIASGIGSTVGGGQFNNATALQATVGGGDGNIASGTYSFIGGGRSSRASGDRSTIGGGNSNNVSAQFGTIIGGTTNIVTGTSATIGGGSTNTASGQNSAIAGGSSNQASGLSSTIGGGSSNIVTGTTATIGGGDANNASGTNSTIGGGQTNNASGTNSTIGGGTINNASGTEATIGGGTLNNALATQATVGGGSTNLVSAAATNGTIGGGFTNTVRGASATIGGGTSNTVSGSFSFIGGGTSNIITGTHAVIPGGSGNTASGDFSFAAGLNSLATHTGVFVWSDSTTTVVLTSTVNDQFNIRASGGMRVFSNANQTAGVTLAANGNTWNSVSDRSLKENFANLDTIEVLNKLINIPIESWNYKSQCPSIRHIGPMAQDFNPAFNFTEVPLGISTLDADGVALASIQGLYKLHEQKISALERSIQDQQQPVICQYTVQVKNGIAEIDLSDRANYRDNEYEAWVSPISILESSAIAQCVHNKVIVRATHDGLYNVLIVGTNMYPLAPLDNNCLRNSLGANG